MANDYGDRLSYSFEIVPAAQPMFIDKYSWFQTVRNNLGLVGREDNSLL